MKIEFEDMSDDKPIAELKVEGIHLSSLEGCGEADITIYVSSEELEEFAATVIEKLSQ